MKIEKGLRIENVTAVYDDELQQRAAEMGIPCPVDHVWVDFVGRDGFRWNDVMLLDDFEDGDVAESYSVLTEASGHVVGLTPSGSRFEAEWHRVYPDATKVTYEN